jgi:hypothetical protein
MRRELLSEFPGGDSEHSSPAAQAFPSNFFYWLDCSLGHRAPPGFTKSIAS